MAAVHRVALERRAPNVAVHLPTLGGTPPGTDQATELFREAVVLTLRDNEDLLRASLDHTPQTNETGRAAALRSALACLDPTSRVDLFEIGASAGLNLRADHLPGLLGIESGPLPTIVDRVGCDLHPLDLMSEEGRLTLSSYVWVDDVVRFSRLARAMDIARRVPARMIRQDAVSFVSEMSLREGSTTLLWHSAFLTYLPRAERLRLDDAVKRIASTATVTRPFIRASWEFTADGRDEFVLALSTWTGSEHDGRSRVLARGDSHCSSVRLAIS